MPEFEAKPMQCPVCRGPRHSSKQYFMNEALTQEKSLWWHCSCGVVFQEERPSDIPAQFGKEYMKKLMEDPKKHKDAAEYPVRLYAPVIEESVYGRKMLDVGYCSPFVMAAMAKRGWVPYGIDNGVDSSESDRLIKGDYENWHFPDGMKFNLIWMGHVLEHFHDPLYVLDKTYDLLSEDGILFISTYCTDFLYNVGSQGVSFWQPKTNYILWSKESLCKKLEALGYEIILARRNHDKRFVHWDDMHIIAQRRFF